MRTIVSIVTVFVLSVVLAGCTALNTVAKGIARKSISGSGAFLYNRVGLDAATQTPEVIGIFVWGDYSSVAAGDEIFRCEESTDASVFNASAVSRKKKIFFVTGDKERMDAVMKKVTETENAAK